MKVGGKTLLVFLIFITISVAEPLFRFAWFTDTHVGTETGAEDLKRAVADVNSRDSLAFVIISGDITELDVDGWLDTAKLIIEKLNVPYYIIPGNHDTKWSASGTRKFAALFGDDCFNFEYKGFRFIGFDQGPLLRMGDGFVTPEHLRWLKRTLGNIENPGQPVFIVNHYPLDESVSNWFEVIDLIKTRNVQAVLHGHGHRNRLTNYAGIPGVMSRSTLRGGEACGGYTIVTVRPDSVFFQECRMDGSSAQVWAALPVKEYDWLADSTEYSRPDYGINQKYPGVKTVWARQVGWAVAGSPAVGEHVVVAANSSGAVEAFDLEDGTPVWEYRTGQAVYSSPAVFNGKVIVASTDSSIYCLNERNGALCWKYQTAAPLVAAPAVAGNRVYIGAGDGKFRCLNLKTGALIWEYADVRGFVEAKPLIYKNKVIFGAWDNCLYALDKRSGKLCWKWTGGRHGVLFSPAAVWPVATRSKVFIAAPDRYLSCIDIRNGSTVWRSNQFKVRETIGISEDKSVIFARTMWDTVIAVDPAAPELQPVWIADAGYGYDIDPSMPVEKEGLLFFGTKNGFVYVLDAATGRMRGVHRLSVALINTVTPIGGRRVVVTAMDGTIALLAID